MFPAGRSFNSLFWDRGFRVSENSVLCDTYYHSGKFTVSGRPACLQKTVCPKSSTHARTRTHTLTRTHMYTVSDNGGIDGG